MTKKKTQGSDSFKFVFIGGLQKSCLPNSTFSVRMWGKMVLYSLMINLYKNVS